MDSLLCIDPGGETGHTGIVLLEYSETAPAHAVETWTVPDGVEGFSAWLDAFNAPTEFEVVCEKFVNRNTLGADLSAMLVEGAVRYVFNNDVIWQPASGKNTAVPDIALERLGMYDLGRGDHHRDRTEAARHGVWVLKKRLHIPTLRKGWPPSA